MQEIPFGAIERPDSIEMPAQNWIDYSDGRHGLALLNRGLPGNNVSDGTMMLSLCGASRWPTTRRRTAPHRPGLVGAGWFEHRL